MRGLTASDLLDLLDRGAGVDWIGRGLLLAGHAWPEATREELLDLPVGVRDRLLLVLRVRTFGGQAEVTGRCGQCGIELEAAVDLAAALDAWREAPPETVTIEVEGEPLEVRLPTSGDLLAAAGLSGAEAETALLERCLVRRPKAPAGALRSAVAAALAEADPLASVECELACQQCGATTVKLFDIVECLWREVAQAARRAALEVHALASAYGWSEREILAMSQARRSLYLGLVSQ